MIDLRSDTVTVPTDEMRKVIANAPVGDDVYGEDPSVNELQEYASDLLGKEAAIFVSSGSMGNQISIAVQTNAGDEVIVESESHIFRYETAAPAIISRTQLFCVHSEKGMPAIETIEAAIRPNEYYYPKTKLVCLENTHNRHGGAIVDLNYIKQVKQLVEKYGLAFHCDGARLWNAVAAKGISPKEYVRDFDTVSVCLSKGLGAPVGSIIAGTKDHINAARKWRKILGGGMRQSGILAAAGLYALKNNINLVAQDHINALNFANELFNCEKIKVNPEKVETNMVFFEYPAEIHHEDLTRECRNKGLLISDVGNNKVRAVFHFQVSREQAGKAAEIIINSVHKLTK